MRLNSTTNLTSRTPQMLYGTVRSCSLILLQLDNTDRFVYKKQIFLCQN